MACSNKKFRLQSSDGEVFDVETEIIKLSTMIKTMLEKDEGGKTEMIPLPNVSAAILKKVIQWCTYHKDDPPLLKDDDNNEKRTDDKSSWDAEFLKVDQGTLLELIIAANYMDIKGLFDVTWKTMGNTIKGMTPEEIRRIFNIKNDFTPQKGQVQQLIANRDGYWIAYLDELGCDADRSGEIYIPLLSGLIVRIVMGEGMRIGSIISCRDPNAVERRFCGSIIRDPMPGEFMKLQQIDMPSIGVMGFKWKSSADWVNLHKTGQQTALEMTDNSEPPTKKPRSISETPAASRDGKRLDMGSGTAGLPAEAMQDARCDSDESGKKVPVADNSVIGSTMSPLILSVAVDVSQNADTSSKTGIIGVPSVGPSGCQKPGTEEAMLDVEDFLENVDVEGLRASAKEDSPTNEKIVDMLLKK